jgi:hypothetical protein
VKTNNHLKNLYEGLTMTEAELQKVNWLNFFHTFLVWLFLDLKFPF